MSALNLSANVQKRLREFLHSDVDRKERGCLLTKAGELIPIENLSAHPEVEIRPGEPDFIAMVTLLQTKELDAWVHSHPQWRPVPSMKDVDNHNIPCDMIIYSCLDGSMRRYNTAEIQQLKHWSLKTKKEFLLCKTETTNQGP